MQSPDVNNEIGEESPKTLKNIYFVVNDITDVKIKYISSLNGRVKQIEFNDRENKRYAIVLYNVNFFDYDSMKILGICCKQLKNQQNYRQQCRFFRYFYDITIIEDNINNTITIIYPSEKSSFVNEVLFDFDMANEAYKQLISEIYIREFISHIVIEKINKSEAVKENLLMYDGDYSELPLYNLYFVIKYYSNLLLKEGKIEDSIKTILFFDILSEKKGFESVCKSLRKDINIMDMKRFDVYIGLAIAINNHILIHRIKIEQALWFCEHGFPYKAKILLDDINQSIVDRDLYYNIKTKCVDILNVENARLGTFYYSYESIKYKYSEYSFYFKEGKCDPNKLEELSQSLSCSIMQTLDGLMLYIYHKEFGENNRSRIYFWLKTSQEEFDRELRNSDIRSKDELIQIEQQRKAEVDRIEKSTEINGKEKTLKVDQVKKQFDAIRKEKLASNLEKVWLRDKYPHLYYYFLDFQPFNNRRPAISQIQKIVESKHSYNKPQNEVQSSFLPIKPCNNTKIIMNGVIIEPVLNLNVIKHTINELHIEDFHRLIDQALGDLYEIIITIKSFI